MKRKIGIIGTLMISFFVFTSLLPGPGKCTGDEEYTKAMKAIGNFRLIKDYRVSLKKGEKITLNISLTAGLKYKFYTEDNPENTSKMIMTIYMKPNEQIKLASTQSNSSKKHFPAIEFECGRSGTYYLVINFEGDDKGCGVGMFTVAK
ncbi:hypothetical protein K6119_17970 [Paracrocinitomix mangrovi]|uniref:hypothetical protein n=1 Tax=Paracrocinitomix mangrovi TaxID=2862509 RepID=UPI001C8F08AA|nr:hypothetical protein [Paracrocinitomix mangrovi]UKN01613.1 hypothetical protein K6119_17970 [Paracrocinitomix mangrovi]